MRRGCPQGFRYQKRLTELGLKDQEALGQLKGEEGGFWAGGNPEGCRGRNSQGVLICRWAGTRLRDTTAGSVEATNKPNCLASFPKWSSVQGEPLGMSLPLFS